MLVLSRKQGQSIEFNDLNVSVQVVSIKGTRVQIGIEAPKSITITRGELPQRAAADDPADDISRIRSELSRVEAELAMLAEMAVEEDRREARQLAAGSIKRLQGIGRSLGATAQADTAEARPIGELVQVRSEVLEQLRSRHSSNHQWQGRIRQTSSPYRVVGQF